VSRRPNSFFILRFLVDFFESFLRNLSNTRLSTSKLLPPRRQQQQQQQHADAIHSAYVLVLLLGYLEDAAQILSEDTRKHRKSQLLSVNTEVLLSFTI
jgi:hypothetical protein